MEPTQPPPRNSSEAARKILAGREMAIRVGKLKRLNRRERRARKLKG